MNCFVFFSNAFERKFHLENRTTGAESMETNQDDTSRTSVEESTAPKDKQALEQEHKDKVNSLV